MRGGFIDYFHGQFTKLTFQKLSPVSRFAALP